MPAFVTHMLLGEEIYRRLGENSPSRGLIDAESAAFSWGLIGPDVLFFRRSFLRRSPLPAYGGAMHTGHTAELFSEMIQYVLSRAEACDGPLLAAYLAGFFGHYRLDSTAHPYIYSTQRRDEGKSADRSCGGAHHRIEADIDSALFWRQTGCPITTLRPKRAFPISREQTDSIGRMLSVVLARAFGLQAAPQELSAAFFDVLSLESLLLDPTDRLVRTLAGGIDRLRRRKSPLSAHVVRRMVEYDVLNLGGQPWDDAARREIRCESFVELFSEA
ncbi:MAG: zinc dependent phospholipase C family protein, partial [Oscillospiraceae bacterium]